jgi:Flp pilus assembly protein TadD
VTNKSKRIVEPIDVQVGQAWSLHYKKQHEQAVNEFVRIVETDPNHIDANYGLGMALAASGRKEEAAQIFQKTMQLVEQKRAGLSDDDDDHSRYDMLSRMIGQQLGGLDK